MGIKKIRHSKFEIIDFKFISHKDEYILTIKDNQFRLVNEFVYLWDDNVIGQVTLSDSVQTVIKGNLEYAKTGVDNTKSIKLYFDSNIITQINDRITDGYVLDHKIPQTKILEVWNKRGAKYKYLVKRKLFNERKLSRNIDVIEAKHVIYLIPSLKAVGTVLNRNPPYINKELHIEITDKKLMLDMEPDNSMPFLLGAELPYLFHRLVKPENLKDTMPTTKKKISLDDHQKEVQPYIEFAESSPNKNLHLIYNCGKNNDGLPYVEILTAKDLQALDKVFTDPQCEIEIGIVESVGYVDGFYHKPKIIALAPEFKDLIETAICTGKTTDSKIVLFFNREEPGTKPVVKIDYTLIDAINFADKQTQVNRYSVYDVVDTETNQYLIKVLSKISYETGVVVNDSGHEKFGTVTNTMYIPGVDSYYSVEILVSTTVKSTITTMKQFIKKKNNTCENMSMLLSYELYFDRTALTNQFIAKSQHKHPGIPEKIKSLINDEVILLEAYREPFNEYGALFAVPYHIDLYQDYAVEINGEQIGRIMKIFNHIDKGYRNVKVLIENSQIIEYLTDYMSDRDEEKLNVWNVSFSEKTQIYKGEKYREKLLKYIKGISRNGILVWDVEVRMKEDSELEMTMINVYVHQDCNVSVGASVTFPECSDHISGIVRFVKTCDKYTAKSVVIEIDDEKIATSYLAQYLACVDALNPMFIECIFKEANVKHTYQELCHMKAQAGLKESDQIVYVFDSGSRGELLMFVMIPPGKVNLVDIGHLCLTKDNDIIGGVKQVTGYEHHGIVIVELTDIDYNWKMVHTFNNVNSKVGDLMLTNFDFILPQKEKAIYHQPHISKFHQMLRPYGGTEKSEKLHNLNNYPTEHETYLRASLSLFESYKDDELTNIRSVLTAKLIGKNLMISVLCKPDEKVRTMDNFVDGHTENVIGQVVIVEKLINHNVATITLPLVNLHENFKKHAHEFLNGIIKELFVRGYFTDSPLRNAYGTEEKSPLHQKQAQPRHIRPGSDKMPKLFIIGNEKTEMFIEVPKTGIFADGADMVSFSNGIEQGRMYKAGIRLLENSIYGAHTSQKNIVYGPNKRNIQSLKDNKNIMQQVDKLAKNQDFINQLKKVANKIMNTEKDESNRLLNDLMETGNNIELLMLNATSEEQRASIINKLVEKVDTFKRSISKEDKTHILMPILNYAINAMLDYAKNVGLSKFANSNEKPENDDRDAPEQKTLDNLMFGDRIEMLNTGGNWIPAIFIQKVLVDDKISYCYTTHLTDFKEGNQFTVFALFDKGLLRIPVIIDVSVSSALKIIAEKFNTHPECIRLSED